jgi:hypothetical protein
MKRDEREYGKLNPNAPPELSRFAFLIGEWRCEVLLIVRDYRVYHHGSFEVGASALCEEGRLI